MIKISIVEDEDKEAELLEQLLNGYAAEHNRKFSVSRYSNPENFLSGFDPETDIVFLDICMPVLTGMEVARKLRESKYASVIIFVTNMLQYAVEGYSVQASDFIVKPASAVSVNRIMDRVLSQLDRSEQKTVMLKDSSSGEITTLKVGDIYFIEINRHRITWHTRLGNFVDWGSMNAVQEQLPSKTFARCHVSYLVNLNHVKGTKKDVVLVGGESLPVSRSYKSAFYAELATYIGEAR